ncbi:hypothetical protein FKM82_031171 [Ascaphus truei]
MKSDTVIIHLEWGKQNLRRHCLAQGGNTALRQEGFVDGKFRNALFPTCALQQQSALYRTCTESLLPHCDRYRDVWERRGARTVTFPLLREGVIISPCININATAPPPLQQNNRLPH